MNDEMNEIFSNLEEGIVLIKNQSINFTNLIFKNIMSNIGIMDFASNNCQTYNHIMDYKIFYLLRNVEVSHSSTGSLGL